MYIMEKKKTFRWICCSRGLSTIRCRCRYRDWFPKKPKPAPSFFTIFLPQKKVDGDGDEYSNVSESDSESHSRSDSDSEKAKRGLFSFLNKHESSHSGVLSLFSPKKEEEKKTMFLRVKAWEHSVYLYFHPKQWLNQFLLDYLKWNLRNLEKTIHYPYSLYLVGVGVLAVSGGILWWTSSV